MQKEEDPLVKAIVGGYYEDSDKTHLLALSDVLEERGDKRYLRIRTLLNLWELASSIPFPTSKSKGPIKSTTGYGGDEHGPNSLSGKTGFAGVRAHAFLAMRWCPRYFYGKKLPHKDQWAAWNLITAEEHKRAVIAAELYWCNLIDTDEMLQKKSNSYLTARERQTYDGNACRFMMDVQHAYSRLHNTSYEFGVALSELITQDGTRSANRPNDRRLRTRIANCVKRWMRSLAKKIQPLITNLPNF